MAGLLDIVLFPPLGHRAGSDHGVTNSLFSEGNVSTLAQSGKGTEREEIVINNAFSFPSVNEFYEKAPP